MAATLGLRPSAYGREGSSPSRGTIKYERDYMTSILTDTDKLFTMFLQYKELLKTQVEDAEQLNHVASQLTVAHMIDHIDCTIKANSNQRLYPFKR